MSCIFWMLTLLDMWFANILSHCIGCPFILLVSFAVQKLSDSCSPLSILVSCVLILYLKKSLPETKSRNLDFSGDPRTHRGCKRHRFASGRSPERGQGNPLRCSCRENPRDRGAWRAAVRRLAQSWTCLKQRSTA